MPYMYFFSRGLANQSHPGPHDWLRHLCYSFTCKVCNNHLLTCFDTVTLSSDHKQQSNHILKQCSKEHDLNVIYGLKMM
jgi:hypothetical protein